MSRYINADAFLKSVKQKAYPQSGSVNESERKISLFGIMEILTAMPTTDVVEVVHGKWIPVKEADADYNQEYECNNCHKHDVHAVSQEVPYCWWCGARMDGEK